MIFVVLVIVLFFAVSHGFFMWVIAAMVSVSYFTFWAYAISWEIVFNLSCYGMCALGLVAGILESIPHVVRFIVSVPPVRAGSRF